MNNFYLSKMTKMSDLLITALIRFLPIMLLKVFVNWSHTEWKYANRQFGPAHKHCPVHIISIFQHLTQTFVCLGDVRTYGHLFNPINVSVSTTLSSIVYHVLTSPCVKKSPPQIHYKISYHLS